MSDRVDTSASASTASYHTQQNALLSNSGGGSAFIPQTGSRVGSGMSVRQTEHQPPASRKSERPWQWTTAPRYFDNQNLIASSAEKRDAQILTDRRCTRASGQRTSYTQEPWMRTAGAQTRPKWSDTSRGFIPCAAQVWRRRSQRFHTAGLTEPCWVFEPETRQTSLTGPTP